MILRDPKCTKTRSCHFQPFIGLFRKDVTQCSAFPLLFHCDLDGVSVAPISSAICRPCQEGFDMLSSYPCFYIPVVVFHLWLVVGFGCWLACRAWGTVWLSVTKKLATSTRVLRVCVCVSLGRRVNAFVDAWRVRELRLYLVCGTLSKSKKSRLFVCDQLSIVVGFGAIALSTACGHRNACGRRRHNLQRVCPRCVVWLCKSQGVDLSKTKSEQRGRQRDRVRQTEREGERERERERERKRDRDSESSRAVPARVCLISTEWVC